MHAQCLMWREWYLSACSSMGFNIVPGSAAVVSTEFAVEINVLFLDPGRLQLWKLKPSCSACEVSLRYC